MNGTSRGTAGGSPSGASLSDGSKGSRGGMSGPGSGAGLSVGGSGGMSGSGMSDMDHLTRVRSMAKRQPAPSVPYVGE